jgi:hypothetical protein
MNLQVPKKKILGISSVPKEFLGSQEVLSSMAIVGLVIAGT